MLNRSVAGRRRRSCCCGRWRDRRGTCPPRGAPLIRTPGGFHGPSASSLALGTRDSRSHLRALCRCRPLESARRASPPLAPPPPPTSCPVATRAPSPALVAPSHRIAVRPPRRCSPAGERCCCLTPAWSPFGSRVERVQDRAERNPPCNAEWRPNPRCQMLRPGRPSTNGAWSYDRACGQRPVGGAYLIGMPAGPPLLMDVLVAVCSLIEERPRGPAHPPSDAPPTMYSPGALHIARLLATHHGAEVALRARGTPDQVLSRRPGGHFQGLWNPQRAYWTWSPSGTKRVPILLHLRRGEVAPSQEPPRAVLRN